MISMIKVDFKAFIYNRVWFGYARAAVFREHGDDIMGGSWEWTWVKVVP